MTVMTKKTLHRLLLHNDLPAFIEQSFYTLNPGAKYLIGGHIYAMAYALERVARGEIKRLIITVPPRHLKSHSISVAFVAWLMGLDPTRRIIAASYAMDLAQDFSLQTRKVMEAPWYREVFPGTTLQGGLPGNHARSQENNAPGAPHHKERLSPGHLSWWHADRQGR
jgi:hypothetical protein